MRPDSLTDRLPGDRAHGDFTPGEMRDGLEDLDGTNGDPRQFREPREPRDREPREPRDREPREPRDREPREPRDREKERAQHEAERMQRRERHDAARGSDRRGKGERGPDMPSRSDLHTERVARKVMTHNLFGWVQLRSASFSCVLIRLAVCCYTTYEARKIRQLITNI
jgi:hypothetical protein